MELLAGYTVLGRLGSGTSGTVWKAHDDTLDRIVAIKALDAPSAASRAQWRSEAQVLAALDDPHLVAVYGYAENAEGAYIIEEWIDGAPLSGVLGAGPLSTAQALGVIRGALLGLAHVHARGLVHGDIAPANILLDTEGTSKLVDFGLSSSAGAASSGSGTTAYASPEAQRGHPVTAPSDVYAAAAVLAYLLRGRAAPFPVLDDIDAALRPVLQRALDPDPAQRYPHAGAFLTAVGSLTSRSTRPLMNHPPTQPAAYPATCRVGARPPRPRSRSPGLSRTGRVLCGSSRNAFARGFAFLDRARNSVVGGLLGPGPMTLALAV